MVVMLILCGVGLTPAVVAQETDIVIRDVRTELRDKVWYLSARIDYQLNRQMLDALQNPDVTVIDSRVRPDWETGTIPGAVSMPYTEMADRLGELGCEVDFDGFDCANAGQIVLFCNGPWCGQSPTAIRRIIEAGYPAEKISYYRWGMQGWRMLGLTVAGGK